VEEENLRMQRETRTRVVSERLIIVFVGNSQYSHCLYSVTCLSLSPTTMSLSSVVSGLVRAQMGTSLKSTVTDDDLDRHIAELIVKEAKAKAARYQTDGVRAYLRKG
jgi:hypothetical protein